MNKEDTLYREKKSTQPFAFTKEVATVFDNMISRSIPCYSELQALITNLSLKHLEAQDKIYDLGVSTGNSLYSLLSNSPKNSDYEITAMDLSEDMLKEAKAKLKHFENHHRLNYESTDLNSTPKLDPCKLVLLVLTLQFLEPKNRLPLITEIYEKLKPGGALILVEKCYSNDDSIESLQTEAYYDFKRSQGYSELEIQQKREALKGILRPYTFEENMLILKEAGFESRDCFFRWGPFVGIIAVKKR